MKKIIPLLFLFCLSPFLSYAQIDWNIDQEAFVPFWDGANYDIEIDGDFLYVNYNNTLRFDLSDPLFPQRSGLYDNAFYSFNYTCFVIAPNGNDCLAYYADNSEHEIYHTLLKFSLSEPEGRNWDIYPGDFRLESDEFTVFGESVQDICLDGEYAYLSISRNDFSTVNLATGSETVFPLSDQIDIDTYGLENSGNYIFITCGTDGLRVIDVNEPTSPQLVGILNDTGDVQDIFIYGTYAYLIASSDIKIIDISDPVHPEYQNTVSAQGTIAKMTIHSQSLYLVKDDGGVEILDLSDPYNAPNPITLEETPGVIDIDFYDNYAYIMSQDGYLDIYEYESDENFSFIKSFGSNCTIEELAFINNFVVGAVRGHYYDTYFALKLYNMDNLEESYDLEENWSDDNSRIARAGDYIYFFSNSLLKIYQFNGETAPQLVSTTNVGIEYKSIAIHDGTLFLFNHYTSNGNLTVYDVSDPSNPLFISDNEGTIFDEVKAYNIVDDKLIIATNLYEYSIMVIDISDPSDLNILSTYTNFDHFNSIIIDEDYIYTQNTPYPYNSSSIKVWDYSNQDTLQLFESNEELGVGYMMKIEDGFLYGISYETSCKYLNILDINDLTSPVLRGSYKLDDSIRPDPASFGFYDHKIFFSDDMNNALTVLNCTEALDVDEKSPIITLVPSDFAISRAYPNPFNPSLNVEIALPQSGLLQVNVFNMLGQKVRTLANQPYSAGTHSFTFDGSSLASGVYFVKASLPGQVNQMQKVVLMK